MRERTERKARARRVLKNHYWLLLTVCLIGVVFGAEFSKGQIVSCETPVQNIVTVENSTSLLRGVGESPVFGRQKGVFAMVVNSLTSGALLNKLRLGISSLLGSQSLASDVMIILGMLFFVFCWIFIQTVYIVITRRIFLEARTYEKVRFLRFLYLIRVRRWAKTAWNMLMLAAFQFLWDLTVVGGVIKHYSYFLVPYILAENPDMDGREAIRLSERMMKGHKWECFFQELTFLPWDFLGFISIGIADVCFVRPYKMAVFGEYYAELRHAAKERGIPGSAQLNDRYLFEKAEEPLLEKAYRDVLGRIKEPVPVPELQGIRGFFSRWFGVVLSNSAAETAYEKACAEQAKLRKWAEILEGKAYPERLFPISFRERTETLETIRYARNYSVLSLLLLFFTCSFMGWLWEVSLHLITSGTFVNRGVLHGPWLPIYGTGSVLILIVLKRLRSRPVLEFLFAIVLCGAVEYATSWYLELVNEEKWWDYTGYFLNLNGRICAEGLLVFGLGGIAVVYVAAPLLDNVFRQVRRRILIPLCAVLLVFFAADEMYSAKYPNTGKGITDYDSHAENVRKM